MAEFWSNSPGSSLTRGALALCAMAFSAGAAAQQHYPDRPIRVVVSYPPGGAADGYTLLVTAESTITINPAVYVSLPYVAMRGLTAITQITKYANVMAWIGLFAPAKTPDAIINRLHEESAKILRLPEVKEIVMNMGAETGGATPKEANTIVRDETAMWAKVGKRAGVKVE